MSENAVAATKSLSGLTGAAGELLVAAELLRRGIAVARPLYDDGVDLLAFRTSNPAKTVPIQVKARSGAGYNFQRDWFCVPGLVLVQVWHTANGPQFYVFRREDVEDALGPQHAGTNSWCVKGVYSVTGEPGPEAMQRMQQHRDRWERITEAM